MLTLALFALSFLPQEAPPLPTPAVEAPRASDAAIDAALREVLEGEGVPGAAAAIVRYGEPARIGAFGLRKTGSDAPITTTDRFHIGSDTKAMNAVLVARLVDAGVLSWDTTIADALPELARSIHEDYRDVTITQLIRHTSGAPANAANWRAYRGKPLVERRRLLIAAGLEAAPSHEPGTKYLYSNFGTMVAATMAAAKAGEPWEALMRKHVFEPLGMASAGFGPPGTRGEVDEPWGHTSRGAGKLAPVQADNDPAMGGAGIVHVSLEDWGKFVMQFSKRAAAESDFLSAASRRKLLEVGRNGYAFGWLVARRGWAGGTVLNHAGSNTMWFAVAWIAPDQDRGFLVAANAATPAVSGLLDGVVGKLIAIDAARMAKEPDRGR